MLPFTGQYTVSIDSSGRIKFSPNFLKDFMSFNSGEVVLHCLPEKCLGIYPLEIWVKMRQEEKLHSISEALQSSVRRRNLRKYGGLTQSEEISKQGRITLPSMFRKFSSIDKISNIIMIGNEIGVEIWNPELWEKELDLILQHDTEKANYEMNNDLNTFVTKTHTGA